MEELQFDRAMGYVTNNIATLRHQHILKLIFELFVVITWNCSEVRFVMLEFLSLKISVHKCDCQVTNRYIRVTRGRIGDILSCPGEMTSRALVAMTKSDASYVLLGVQGRRTRNHVQITITINN
jgi:hypothetical protein